MMNFITTSATTAVLLLLLASTSHAFAPPSSSLHLATQHHTTTTREETKQYLVPPNEFLSILLSSDAVADAVVDAAANVAADATIAASVVDATTTAVESASSSSFMPSYSNASYYTTLALYVLSFPGLWSQIKRSTKAKVKRKTYTSTGEAADGGKELRQQAGEIMAYMKANNYEVAEAGETITFRGLVARSTSQAFFLTFCTVLGMASLALVLQTQFQDATLPVIGTPINWFFLTLLSPYAGIYYWKSGDRVDEMKVKLAASDDDMLNEITIEGNDEEIERMWRTLDFQEKGMVKVEGIF